MPVAIYTGAAHAVAVNSGTSGLHLAFARSEFARATKSSSRPSPLSRPPMRFVSSAPFQCLSMSIAETLNINPAKIEEAITPRTRAIRRPHLRVSR